MARRTREDQGFTYDCSVYLSQRWEEVKNRFEGPDADEVIEPLALNQEMILLIRDCLQSSTLTYHYVLPTQLLAKAGTQRLMRMRFRLAIPVPAHSMPAPLRMT